MTESHALGPLELKVLGQFRAKEPASVAEVRERLSRDGDELAYTTVMTVLSRLHAKGVLTRRREGKRFLYVVSSSSKRATGMLARIQRSLFGGSRLAPVTALLDAADVSTQELKELRRLIDDKLKERGR